MNKAKREPTKAELARDLAQAVLAIRQVSFALDWLLTACDVDPRSVVYSADMCGWFLRTVERTVDDDGTVTVVQQEEHGLTLKKILEAARELPKDQPGVDAYMRDQSIRIHEAEVRAEQAEHVATVTDGERPRANTDPSPN